METIDKLGNGCVDFTKPLWSRCVSRHDNAAVMENDRLQPTSELKNGRSDHARPGVDAENPKSALSIGTHVVDFALAKAPGGRGSTRAVSLANERPSAPHDAAHTEVRPPVASSLFLLVNRLPLSKKDP